MTSKRVFITLPPELRERVKKYNSAHEQNPISISGICKKALEEFLKAEKY